MMDRINLRYYNIFGLSPMQSHQKYTEKAADTYHMIKLCSLQKKHMQLKQSIFNPMSLGRNVSHMTNTKLLLHLFSQYLCKISCIQYYLSDVLRPIIWLCFDVNQKKNAKSTFLSYSDSIWPNAI